MNYEKRTKTESGKHVKNQPQPERGSKISKYTGTLRLIGKYVNSLLGIAHIKEAIGVPLIYNKTGDAIHRQPSFRLVETVSPTPAIPQILPLARIASVVWIVSVVHPGIVN